MYKAGDLTGGKMNEMFTTAYSGGCIDINHKQLGRFLLVSYEYDVMNLMTALELRLGVYPSYEDDGTRLISILSDRDSERSGIDKIALDNYTNESLIDGVLFLSDKCSLPRDGDCYASRQLMRIACASDGLMGVPHISNASPSILNDTLKRNNSLSIFNITKFLESDCASKSAVFYTVSDWVRELAILSNPASNEHWNNFSYSSLFFHAQDALEGDLSQEAFCVCVEHLTNEGIIEGLCEDDYALSIKEIALDI